MPLPIPNLHGAYLRHDVLRLHGRHRLDEEIAAHVIVPLWHGVVVDAARLIDPLTRAAAAQLTIGSRSVLSGLTAAHLHGCTSAAEHTVHVHVPYNCGRRSGDGLVVHHGGRLADDVRLHDGLRLLAFDRVVADLLCTLPWKRRARDALAILDEALRLAGDAHEPFRKSVGERLAQRQDPRGTVRARGLLDLGSQRAESPPESWLRLVLIENDIPVPEVNWVITSSAGQELFRLDLAWPRLRICVEYDGWESHAGREIADESRAAELRRHGWVVHRATADDLRDPYRLLSQLRHAFAERGYTW